MTRVGVCLDTSHIEQPAKTDDGRLACGLYGSRCYCFIVVFKLSCLHRAASAGLVSPAVAAEFMHRTTIERHLLSSETDPFSRAPLTSAQLIADVELKMKMQQWMALSRKQQ